MTRPVPPSALKSPDIQSYWLTMLPPSALKSPDIRSYGAHDAPALPASRARPSG
ncbi:MAG: hypothetical protein LBQ12_06825 [Deltaproteobacteria bacterium]|nr:hypothetical protein [Deltaproteobacteria bacterium]